MWFWLVIAVPRYLKNFHDFFFVLIVNVGVFLQWLRIVSSSRLWCYKFSSFCFHYLTVISLYTKPWTVGSNGQVAWKWQRIFMSQTHTHTHTHLTLLCYRLIWRHCNELSCLALGMYQVRIPNNHRLSWFRGLVIFLCLFRDRDRLLQNSYLLRLCSSHFIRR